MPLTGFGADFFQEVLGRTKAPLAEFMGARMPTALASDPSGGFSARSGSVDPTGGFQSRGLASDPSGGFRSSGLATLGEANFAGMGTFLQNWSSSLATAGATRAKAQAEKEGRAVATATESRQRYSRAPVSEELLADVRPEYREIVLQATSREGMDPLLVAALMRQEGGQTGAVSSAGARGPMQLMPGTAAGLGVTNINDPRQNIDAGVRYLRQAFDAVGGDPTLALVYYNGGPGAVARWRQGQPYGESVAYVRGVMGRYAELQQTRSEQEQRQQQQWNPNPKAAEVFRTGVSQNNLGMPPEIAAAICGPAAVYWFVQSTGRAPTWNEVWELAKSPDPALGGRPAWAGQQQGPQSIVSMLNRLGVTAHLETYRSSLDTKIRDEVLAGRPVMIDTPGHYYQVTGYNPQTGGFTLGDAVGRAAGAAGVQLGRLDRVFPSYGAVRSVIFLSEP